MSRIAVILPAAGKSSRFKGKEKKPFANIDGRPVWLRTAELFVNREDVCQCLLIVSPDDVEMVKRRYGANMAFMNIELAEGGKERFDSVARALDKLKDEVDLVAVHDAVRPCVQAKHIDAVLARSEQTGAAMVAVPVSSTLKRVDGQKQVTETVDRKGLWQAQTPQVFRRDWLVEAYANRGDISAEITDDAQLVEELGHTVHVVEGELANIKITANTDLALAESILKSRPKPKPSGPLHPFAEDDMWR